MPFLWLPSALGRSTHTQATRLAFWPLPNYLVLQPNPELLPEQVILRTYPQAFARAVPSICNTLPHLSPTSLLFLL